MQSTALAKKKLHLLPVFALIFAAVGCDLFEGTLAPLPFARITSVQLFDEPNFTVALSVDSAVADPSLIAKINWVFGDGTGFEEGTQPTITHRYASAGSFEVTAFLFDAEGLVDQIITIITVQPNDQAPEPEPVPEDLPGQIFGAEPTDGDEDVAVDAVLSWFAGLDAESHDVYLGTVAEVLENAGRADTVVFMGNQTDTMFDPQGLDPDKEYFWRIDEVNEAGTTKGEVLSFRTAEVPEPAESPIPANGSASARVDQLLEWVAGEHATSHDVFLGNSLSEVRNATTDDEDIFQGNESDASFDPEDDAAVIDGELLPDTEYFWRIDEVGPGGTTAGAVWSFRTQAAPPMIMTAVPTDFETNVDVNQILSWTASPAVESFDVYFGTDAVSVGSAMRDGAAEFRGNRTVATFDPGTLLGGTEYFWRIDTLGPGGTTPGDVLRFTTTAPPGQVTGPFTPADDATNIDIETNLSWNAGAGSTVSYDVYVGSNSDAVANGLASALQGNQDASLTSFDLPEALLPATLFFWRVDAIGPGGKTTGLVLSFTTGNQPEMVAEPSPANGANGAALDVTLEWSAAVGATGYEVYFGEVQQDVQNAAPADSEFRGSISTTMFAPGPLFPGNELQGNTSYFWRIDSTGPGGTTKGDVWSFTTGPQRATDPMPEHESIGEDVNAQILWTASASAESYDVYLGTNATAVENATTATPVIFRGNLTETMFDPGTLDPVTTYYWRIDPVASGDGGTTKGELWEFTTGAAQATMPAPANGASGVSITPMLDWTTAADSTEEDVFFGSNRTTVEDADRGSPVYRGAFAVGGSVPPFNPGILDGITTYFWRVDSVTPDGTTEGEVWQFITGPGKATGPLPTNFAMDVAIDRLLKWTAGIGAVTHDVYLIDQAANDALGDAEKIANADTSSPTFRAAQSFTTFDPGMLTADAVYLWRIDEVAADGTTRTTGDVWRFTTIAPPEQASSPTPINGATNVDVDVTLNWAAAQGADSYDVHFSTDMSNLLPQGNQVSRSFNPGTLTAGTTYYWRIDAVNEAGTTTGVIWSFTTSP